MSWKCCSSCHYCIFQKPVETSGKTEAEKNANIYSDFSLRFNNYC
ncbi:hypothetical protein HMPREF3226_00350 [Prevotella corporis]|uniref:Uncharacterized protein n=1 Tax=Prevotella corporis TaxID=28128 RepID=A0A133QM13_9BACT|nr:hypothetical protein HMPREF3226_00350 [Prevotella corporis]